MGWCRDGSCALVSEVLHKLTAEELAWISTNRDWAEATRYECKDEVDRQLLTSPAVSSRRIAIERLFAENKDDFPEFHYLAMLRADWASLHGFNQHVLMGPTGGKLRQDPI
jgi:hypothetical protein